MIWNPERETMGRPALRPRRRRPGRQVARVYEAVAFFPASLPGAGIGPAMSGRWPTCPAYPYHQGGLSRQPSFGLLAALLVAGPV